MGSAGVSLFRDLLPLRQVIRIFPSFDLRSLHFLYRRVVRTTEGPSYRSHFLRFAIHYLSSLRSSIETFV